MLVGVQKVNIRDARPSEASILTELAFRSKAYWGYPEDFMEKCRRELTVTEDELADPGLKFAVADKGGRVFGFYSLGTVEGIKIELEALFVEPSAIGCGIGWGLLAEAKKSALRAGAKRMIIQGDPNASGFYIKAGATHIGESPSASIIGRMLPLYELELEADN